MVEEGRDILSIKRQLRERTAPARAPERGATQAVHREWDFGDLPESMEVERNRLRLRVYPAIADRGSFVERVEARSAAEAEAISREGLTRLILLSLPQQVKYVSHRFTQDRELVLLGSGLKLPEPLPQALTMRAVRECFLPDAAPIPRTAQAFSDLLDSKRADLAAVADTLATLVGSILRDWRTIRMELGRLRSPAFGPAAADIEAHLAMLLPPDFIRTTPREWLEHFPRYLKTARRRVERLSGNVARDAELAARVAPFANALRRLLAQPSGWRPRPELQQLRWMVEEFRVSLFAQELRTVLRVSEKRLAEQLERARAEARA